MLAPDLSLLLIAKDKTLSFQMFKTSKKVTKAMLKEGLLAEGGGLTEGALAKLNEQNRATAINDSDGENPGLEKKPTFKRAQSKLSDETKIDGLEEFDKYKNSQGRSLFEDLTVRSFVDTELEVINVIITYDSKHAIAIVNHLDEHFELQGYILETQEKKFSHVFKGEYIKMNMIEQDSKGEVYAIAYQDNGKFFLSFIDNTGEVRDHLDVSQTVVVDDLSKPITGFWEPLITCAFT